jgi:hypothetical protein
MLVFSFVVLLALAAVKRRWPGVGA